MYYKLATDSITGKVGLTDADGDGARAIELIEVIQAMDRRQDALDKRLEALEARMGSPVAAEQPGPVAIPALPAAYAAQRRASSDAEAVPAGG